MNSIVRTGALLVIPVCLQAQEVTEGSLRRVNHQGLTIAECPLKRTSVMADVAGMIARVTVEQNFQNPFSEAIEAVYVFPLPHEASVHDMTMTVGTRVIKGKIKTREEARLLYEAAKNAGQTAS